MQLGKQIKLLLDSQKQYVIKTQISNLMSDIRIAKVLESKYAKGPKQDSQNWVRLPMPKAGEP